MRVLGMISGTSHDGIDCAIVKFSETDGVLEAVLEHRSSVPYSAELRSQLSASLPPAPVELSVVTALDTGIGKEFAAAAESAIAASAPVDLICSHGQTVFHWVEEGTAEGSLQLGQPAWIAERTKTPVISDVRARDITAGGHGAPLVPVLDALMLREIPGVRAALNLGGISNATIVDSGEPVAYDIGPANALIDAAVRMTGAHPDGIDPGGALAAAGRVDPALLRELLAEPYYAETPPKSTGKERFNAVYVRDVLERSGAELSAEDLIATLTELTVRTTGEALRHAEVTTVVVSGGGALNLTIMRGLRRELPDARIVTTDELGIDSDVKEAFAFALIGWLTWHGLPGSVPSATGAGGARILGTITPGEGPLQLPMPKSEIPSRLRIRNGVPADRSKGLSIRAAEPGDQQAIEQVFYDCWTINYPGVLPERLINTVDRAEVRSIWRRSLSDIASSIRVAAVDEQIVGVIGFSMSEEMQGHIRSLYVSPHAQGGGYGRKLVETAVAELSQRGAEAVTLWVFEENYPSRRFYERMGWRPDGERVIDPAFGEPQIRMTRSLT